MTTRTATALLAIAAHIMAHTNAFAQDSDEPTPAQIAEAVQRAEESDIAITERCMVESYMHLNRDNMVITNERRDTDVLMDGGSKAVYLTTEGTIQGNIRVTVTSSFDQVSGAPITMAMMLREASEQYLHTLYSFSDGKTRVDGTDMNDDVRKRMGVWQQASTMFELSAINVAMCRDNALEERTDIREELTERNIPFNVGSELALKRR